MYLGDAEPSPLLTDDIFQTIMTTSFCRTADGRQIFAPSPLCAPEISTMPVFAKPETPQQALEREAKLATLRAELERQAASAVVDYGHMPYGKNTCSTPDGRKFSCGSSVPCVTADGRSGHTTDYFGRVCEADAVSTPVGPALKPAGVALLAAVGLAAAWWLS